MSSIDSDTYSNEAAYNETIDEVSEARDDAGEDGRHSDTIDAGTVRSDGGPLYLNVHNQLGLPPSRLDELAGHENSKSELYHLRYC